MTIEPDTRAINRIYQLREGRGWADNEGWKELADELGVNRGLLWSVAHGKKRSHLINRAIGVEKTQIRLAATVTMEQRQALYDMVSHLDMTWTEFCCFLADNDTNLWIAEGSAEGLGMTIRVYSKK